MRPVLLPILLCAVLVSGVAVAADFGWVSGTIVTDKGKPASSVLVTVLGTGRSALSDGDGKFSITSVPTGTWQLEFRPHERTSFVLPLPVQGGENALGVITLQPESLLTRKDPAFVGWKRIGVGRAAAYRLGADCASALTDTLPPGIVRLDSTIGAGKATLALDPADPSRLSFAFLPKGPVAPLAMVVYDARGRAVKRLRSGPGSLPSALSWDGRDESGHDVPPGSYRARFTSARESVDFPFCRREVALPSPPGSK